MMTNDYLNLFKIIRNSNIYKINLVNTTNINDEKKIYKYLSRMPLMVELFMHYLHFNKNILEEISKYDNYKLNILIDNKVQYSKIVELKNIKNMIFTIIISNDNDLKYIVRIFDDLNITNFIIKPLYTKQNYDFFKENVFIDQNIFMEYPIQLDDILINKVLNTNYFGKLTILPNGDIISTFSKNKLGNLFNENLKLAIYKELKGKRSWKLTRQNIIPCKKCIFNEMCPPISNYEIVVKKMICVISNF